VHIPECETRTKPLDLARYAHNPRHLPLGTHFAQSLLMRDTAFTYRRPYTLLTGAVLIVSVGQSEGPRSVSSDLASDQY
jgi:hypothetical protein